MNEVAHPTCHRTTRPSVPNQEQAETFNRATNRPLQTQKSRERPSTPQQYRDNPDLLKSVFEWSPERSSTSVEKDERSSSEGRQQSDDPTVPTRSLRRITKKIPERNNARQRETGTELAQRDTAMSQSDSTDHTSADSVASCKASSTFTIYDGPDPFARRATSGQSSTARARFDAMCSTSFVSRLDVNSSVHTKRRGTGQ